MSFSFFYYLTYLEFWFEWLVILIWVTRNFDLSFDLMITKPIIPDPNTRPIIADHNKRFIIADPHTSPVFRIRIRGPLLPILIRGSRLRILIRGSLLLILIRSLLRWIVIRGSQRLLYNSHVLTQFCPTCSDNSVQRVKTLINSLIISLTH